MVQRLLASFGLVGLGLCVACAEQAGPSPAKSDAAAIAKLVAQLGSERFEDRKAASKALDALGPTALDALRNSLAGREEEARRRAIDLVQRIEVRLETARLTQPKLVHLVYKDTPLSEAVQDIARKTGFQIQLEGDQTKFAKRKITLDTGEIPFWQAVDRFCQKAGLMERGSAALPDNPVAPVAVGNDFLFLSDSLYVGPPAASPLVFVDGKPQSVPTHYAGAVRIRILPRLAPSPAGGNDGTPQHQTSPGIPLTVEISPEPTLGLQRILGVRVERILDENGSELKTPLPYISDPADNSGVHLMRAWSNTIDFDRSAQDFSKRVPIRLHAPEGVKRLKEIRGFVAAEVLTPHEPLISVEDILNAADKTVAGKDGGSMKILEVKRDDKGQIVLRVVVEKPPTREVAPTAEMAMVFLADVGGVSASAAPAPDPAVNAIAEFLSLVDGKNQAFKLIAAEDQLRDNQINEYRLTFQPPSGAPKPAKLMYSGRRHTTIDVPFVIKDVPLR
jgi:hypothetical protein